MMMKGLTGTRYQLDGSRMNTGGEGDIYRVIEGGGNRVAKIYHELPSRELEEKLAIMVKHPPDDSVLNQAAWPLDLLYGNNRQFRGFIMPKLKRIKNTRKTSLILILTCLK